MIEHAVRGSRRYFAWLGLLALLSSLALAMFIYQCVEGLGVTAMSRDVPWGFYIAQLTFLVGVAASAVMVVLPYYLHDYRAFGRITILGEFLAIPAVILCVLFVGVDIGQPRRVLNLFLHPTPNSVLFWDTVCLFGYLVLNIVIGWKTLTAEHAGMPPPRWVKVLAYISIPWAFSIHTATAFLYSGLAARPFWFTAVLAPRFLASAFAAGPALLIILCFVVRRLTRFDPGDAAIAKLAQIVAYALVANLFLFGAELFTALYSDLPHHVAHFQYLFFGIGEHRSPVAPFMWASVIMSLVAVVLLVNPKTRKDQRLLFVSCAFVFIAIWIDKGAGMLTGGMVPSPLGDVPYYFPSWVEVGMGIGLYAFGAAVLTVLYKVAVSVKQVAET